MYKIPGKSDLGIQFSQFTVNKSKYVYNNGSVKYGFQDDLYVYM